MADAPLATVIVILPLTPVTGMAIQNLLPMLLLHQVIVPALWSMENGLAVELLEWNVIPLYVSSAALAELHTEVIPLHATSLKLVENNVVSAPDTDVAANRRAERKKIRAVMGFMYQFRVQNYVFLPKHMWKN